MLIHVMVAASNPVQPVLNAFHPLLKLFGWIMAAHQVGAAASASFAGFIRTAEGNYDHAFMFAGVLCLISAVGVLFAGKRPAAPALSPQPG